MARFHNHPHPLRLQLLPDGLRDLAAQTLLELQAPRIKVHQPGQLAQPHNLFIGNVGDVALAEKRQQVVLAQTEDFNVFDDDHLVVGNREVGRVDDLVEILPVAAGQEAQSVRHPLGRALQAVPLRVFPQQRQDAPVQTRDLIGRGLRPGKFHFGPINLHGVLPSSPRYSNEFKLVSSNRTRATGTATNPARRRWKISMQRFSVVGTLSPKLSASAFR